MGCVNETDHNAAYVGENGSIDTNAAKSKITTGYAIGAIVVLAAALRIVGIWKGVWIDEAASVFYTDATFAELIQKLSLGNAPPFTIPY